MKVVTLTAFGAGYLLGTKAGRQRYEQILQLARQAAEGLEGSQVQERLQAYATRLEDYGRRNGSPRDGASRAPRAT
jgi:hypothetical protein